MCSPLRHQASAKIKSSKTPLLTLMRLSQATPFLENKENAICLVFVVDLMSPEFSSTSRRIAWNPVTRNCQVSWREKS